MNAASEDDLQKLQRLLFQTAELQVKTSNDKSILDVANSLAGKFAHCHPSANPDFKWKDKRSQDFQGFTAKSSPDGLIDSVFEHGALLINRSRFDSSITAYLNSGIRNTEIDRLLIRSLIDMEATAYIYYVLHLDPTVARLRDDPREINATSLYLEGRIKNILSWGAPLLILWGVQQTTSILHISIPIIMTMIAMCFVLYDATKVWFMLNRLKEDEKNVIEKNILLPREMEKLHEEISQPSSIRIDALIERLEDTRLMGAVWPDSLWKIIETLEKEGVKYI